MIGIGGPVRIRADCRDNSELAAHSAARWDCWQWRGKVSGLRQPSAADAAAFDQTVAAVTAATEQLLGALRARTALRTRKGEAAKARARGESREARRGEP
jgi:hypothetical protein